MKNLKLRAAPAYMTLVKPRIDRENLIMRDVVAMVAGVEALGHGLESDQTTIEVMATLGNRRLAGIRQRFGHPGMSENAEGKKIGMATNFRVQGDKLLHDIQFMRAAKVSPVFANDPVEYIFQMAEQHPGEIAESVAISADAVWKLSDGREVSIREEWDADIEVDQDGRPLNATHRLPVIRPVAFSFVDVVSEGALTHDGLFGAEVLEEMFADTAGADVEEAFRLLDEWRLTYGVPLEQVPKKVQQVLARYLDSRGRKKMSGPIKNQPRRNGAQAASLSMSGDGIAPTGDGEIDDVDTVELPAVGSGDEGDELDAADVKSQETAGRVSEPAAQQNEPDATMPVSTAEYAALKESFERLYASFAQLNTNFGKLVKIVLRNNNTLDEITRDIRHLEGETVVRANVRGGGGVQQFGARHGVPVPPKALQHQQPGVVSGSQVPTFDFETDPERATLEAMMSRQQPKG